MADDLIDTYVREVHDALPMTATYRERILEAIKFENVANAVHDLEAVIAVFTDLGLTVNGRSCTCGPAAFGA